MQCSRYLSPSRRNYKHQHTHDKQLAIKVTPATPSLSLSHPLSPRARRQSNLFNTFPSCSLSPPVSINTISRAMTEENLTVWKWLHKFKTAKKKYLYVPWAKCCWRFITAGAVSNMQLQQKLPAVHRVNWVINRSLEAITTKEFAKNICVVKSRCKHNYAPWIKFLHYDYFRWWECKLPLDIPKLISC